MATNGTASPVAGAADIFGGKGFNVLTYSGAASYNNGIGDRVDVKLFGFQNKLIVLSPMGLSVSGTYYTIPQPANQGLTAWYLRWYILSNNQEVAGGQNLSGESIQLMGMGI